MAGGGCVAVGGERGRAGRRTQKSRDEDVLRLLLEASGVFPQQLHACECANTQQTTAQLSSVQWCFALFHSKIIHAE